MKGIASQYLTSKPINYESLNESILVITNVSIIGSKSSSWFGQWIDIKHGKLSHFQSREFIPAQPNYPIHEKGLLANINELQTFEHDFIGAKFIIVTNHKSL